MTKSQRERAEKAIDKFLDSPRTFPQSLRRDFIAGYAAGLADEDVRALVEALEWYQRNYTAEYTETVVNKRFRKALARFEGSEG